MEVQDLILVAYKISHPLALLTTNIYFPIKKQIQKEQRSRF